MKNIGNMLKQAQEMQTKLAEVQARLAAMEVDGTAGAGLVTVTMSGKNDIKKVKVDPSLIDPNEAEVLEDLIVAAAADAKTKVDETMQEEMAKLTGGMQMPPGMKLPF